MGDINKCHEVMDPTAHLLEENLLSTLLHSSMQQRFLIVFYPFFPPAPEHSKSTDNSQCSWEKLLL